MPLVQIIDPPGLGRPNPIYASITAAKLSPTTTLYTVAGQVAEDPSDGSVPASLPAQLDLCLRRLDICLEHIGARKTDISRFMYYIRQGGLDEFDAQQGKGEGLKLIVQKAMGWLEGHRPASCYNRVFGMTDDKYLCEFEMMVITSTEA